MMESRNLNFNIGVLGHVDSGKTSLAKALSTVASTACFDKNPQSKERGITIDLGFSSFVIDAPDHIKELGYEKLQFTLVDCPGHASLIRTIIGGAQIIDAMMLVVDITKGIQTQTAECLVIGEILCDHLLVVLNKVDLIAPEKQKSVIEKITKKILLTLQQTKFGHAKVIVVAAKPGGPDAPDVEPLGLKDLMDSMQKFSYVPNRETGGSLLYAVDHCFSIRGQGTVMTGTVLQGSVAINDSIEIPSLKVSKKVKSMQMFRQPVEKVSQGDRVGICVTQFDPKQLERGVVGSPGFIQTAFGVLAEVVKISYYKLPVETKSKFHVSLGHETVMARVTFFGTEDILDIKDRFMYDHTYKYQQELFNLKKLDDDASYKPSQQFALLEFEKAVQVVPNSVLIGSKLDMDVHTNMCRLAFRGNLLEIFTDKNYHDTQLQKVKVYKSKSKEGVIERLAGDNEVIVKNLLKKDTNTQLFIGLKVKLSTGEEGTIDGTFGQSGKLKVRVTNGLQDTTKAALQKLTGGKKKSKGGQENQPHAAENLEPVKIILNFKKYIFNNDKKMVQV
ncbi:selenocysteine-specific elongation factor-like [Homarus americanus]|uniref:Selenocysteine-specific elongation factor n=1 Tax=Homarus americanus TaxID=6706 RepID=A0A8J5JIA5_HOMAM|nr:selenocysteine-specific elongation factor-like [Homarus americanus]KAG7158100.1 Selenocysteine-specific elongation factor-like [Homarus americanus]